MRIRSAINYGKRTEDGISDKKKQERKTNKIWSKFASFCATRDFSLSMGTKKIAG